MSSTIVTPPWNLCGFDPDFDPYTAEFDRLMFRYRYELGPWRGGFVAEHAIERVVDPNAADGRWFELAFMPFRPALQWDPGRGRALEVPWYESVSTALFHERTYRQARAEIAARARGDG